MTRVRVAVEPRPYDVIIENASLSWAGECLRQIMPDRTHCFVVTVPRVRRRWGKKLMSSLGAAGWHARLLEMRDGERYKRLATVEDLAERLARLGADRNAVIVAFGGGVVGDVTGLLASLYMRGVDFVQVPTTLLAQVDASVGGKTGVNLRTGKNLLGIFHQPRSVLIDPAVLRSLPDREFRSGLYESLKCGVIGRPELFRHIEERRDLLLRRDAAELEWVIAESVKLKARIVSADEREGGLRRVLNFGHTIGHALEAATDYQYFLHGEAIGWGMIAATHIAASVGKLDRGIAKQVSDTVLGLGPLPRVEVPGRNILRRLQADKKTKNGVVHFVLPRRIGKVEVVSGLPHEIVVEAVEEIGRMSRG